MLTNSLFLFNIARMRISCPQCHASYEVGPLIRNAVLVCHRCHNEFSMEAQVSEAKEEEQGKHSEASLPLFEKTPASKQESPQTHPQQSSPAPAEAKEGLPSFLIGDHEYSEQMRREKVPFPEPVSGNSNRRKANADLMIAAAQTELPPPDAQDNVPHVHLRAEDEIGMTAQAPSRANVELWPWLIVILMVIGSVGFWYKKDAWLNDPWFRSVLINLQLPVEVRDKDWLIIPSSVQGHWIKRDDGSQALVIQGRVENLLYTDLMPPQILVRFYDDTGITESLGEKIMSITEPPSMEQVRHAPFTRPGVDKIIVESKGQRGFFLVLEDLPDRTADFTLTPVAGK